MAKQSKAKEPFRFYTRLILSEMTGLKAADLNELARIIKKVDAAAIYNHTHRFLQQHQYLAPEPPNDFAYWVSEVLGERELGEKLASIDTIEATTIRELREKIMGTIEDHLKDNPSSRERTAKPGEEFYFIKAVSFIFPTNYLVYDLEEFTEMLKKVTIQSIYFHIFESRLRLEKGNNDFSYWIGTNLGEKEIAKSISKLDPYSYTLEDLRSKIIDIIEKRTKGAK